MRSTAAALQALGAVIGTDAAAEGTVTIRLRGGGDAGAAKLPDGGGEMLDCGNSGTSARLLAGALAGRAGPGGSRVTLVGDASLSGRPMGRVAAPLRLMGAGVETTGGCLPMRVSGRRPLLAIDLRLPVASAQVLGAVTLAALAAGGRTTLETPGPTRDHTERLLAWLGAAVARSGNVTTIEGPAAMRAQSLAVPGDISSAAAWLVAGALHPDAEVRLVGVGLNPSRLAIVDALCEMGASIDVRPAQPADDGEAASPEPSGDMLVRGGAPLHAIRLSGPRVAELIDELPLLAVAMSAADGVSELRDAAELRVKESDRIALVVRNLRASGVVAEELPDGWRVTGNPDRVGRGLLRRATGANGGPGPAAPVEILTAGDHRIAIAFSIGAAAGIIPAVIVDDAACADVSYPGFWDDLEMLTNGAETSR